MPSQAHLCDLYFTFVFVNVRISLLQRFNTLRVSQSHNFENRIDWLESARWLTNDLYIYIFIPQSTWPNISNMNFDLLVHLPLDLSSLSIDTPHTKSSNHINFRSFGNANRTKNSSSNIWTNKATNIRNFGIWCTRKTVRFQPIMLKIVVNLLRELIAC